MEKVNPHSRREKAKETARTLTQLVGEKITDSKRFPEFHDLFDRFDHLSTDWVFSDVLEWEGSSPDKTSKKIVEKVAV
jgi:hypothetical protein